MIAVVAMASIVGMSATAVAGEAKTPALRGTTIETLVLTAEPTKAFRECQPISNPLLKSGDQIHLYGEPGNFGWRIANDAASFNMVAAMEVRDRNGHITGKAEPRTMKYDSASRPANFFFSLSVKVEGPVGAYDLVVQLRDSVNGQVAERVFPFVVAKKRQEPAVSHPTTAQVAKPSTRSGNRGKPLDCRQYFPQIGEVIAVRCAQ
jgi:hypothetical protein